MQSIIDQLAAKGIRVRGPGRYRIICPFCAHKRKPQNQKERDLTVFVDAEHGGWNCHHCQEKGAVFENAGKGQNTPHANPRRTRQPSSGGSFYRSGTGGQVRGGHRKARMGYR